MAFLADMTVDWEAESEKANGAGIPTATARYGVVFADDAPAFRRLALPFRLGVGGRLGSGRQYMPWITLDDAVAATTHLLDGDLTGPVNVVAPVATTNADLTRALGRVLRRPAFMMVPQFVMRLALGELAGALLFASNRVARNGWSRTASSSRSPRSRERCARCCGAASGDGDLPAGREAGRPRHARRGLGVLLEPAQPARHHPALARPRGHLRPARGDVPRLVITYTVRPFLGVPLHWATEITHVEDRVRFVDDQRIGPYSLWHHEHDFREVEGGAEVRDTVHYAVPFGPLGDIAAQLAVRPRARHLRVPPRGPAGAVRAGAGRASA